MSHQEPVSILSTDPEQGPGIRLPMVVLSNDNRRQVVDPGHDPARYVGRVKSAWRDGSVSYGTGTLIGQDCVLTCGHNFYDAGKQGRCANATFQLGLTRDNNGAAVALSAQIPLINPVAHPYYEQRGLAGPPVQGVGWAEATNYLNDIGFAKLKSPWDKESTCQPYRSVDADFSAPGLTCDINGYSSDQDATVMTQYARHGYVTLLGNFGDLVVYQMSTSHGDSGAAVYYRRYDYWAIVAIHVTGVPETPGPGTGGNVGSRLIGDNYEWIQNMLGT
jgi:V8-like Glu-specific endopeptidase